MRKRQVNSPRTPLYRDTGFELYDAATTTRVMVNAPLIIFSVKMDEVLIATDSVVRKVKPTRLHSLLSELSGFSITGITSAFIFGTITGP